MREEALTRPGADAPLSFPTDRPIAVKAY